MAGLAGGSTQRGSFSSTIISILCFCFCCPVSHQAPVKYQLALTQQTVSSVKPSGRRFRRGVCLRPAPMNSGTRHKGWSNTR